MSEVLYRKYRPQTFADVVGQEHVTGVLSAQVVSKNISHAYLFAGTRGTGKTSVARIFARALGTSTNDLYEIDAASNTSVDDIRALNESVHTLPFDSVYKIYILDEVHMLSKSASNALLKTLEEPPAHVIFFFFTTETHKIPETVMSRCEVYTFKKPSQDVLKRVVINIIKKEGSTIDEQSADLIALLGDGSFRDTQGIIQKVLSFAKTKKITEEEVRCVTGAPAVTLIHDLFEAIADGDISGALSVVHTATSQNIDMLVFLKLILHSMRTILLARAGALEIIARDLSPEEKKFVTGFSSNPIFSSKTLVELLTAYENTQGSYIPSLPLELAVITIIGTEGGKESKKV